MGTSDFIETTGNRGAAFALDLIVQRIELAFDSGDYASASGLIEQHLLEAWFGLNPEALLRTLLTIEASGHPLPPLTDALKYMMLALTAAESGDGPTPGADQFDAVQSHDTGALFQSLGAMFALRLQGRPVEALKMSGALATQRAAFQPLFTAQGGLGLFGVLQTGLTAMLAGNFTLAEATLTEAQLHQPVQTLPFLTRDAHSKMAALHACFGDPAIARAELERSEKLPRTNSWIEPVLDTQAAMVRLILDPVDPHTILDRLEAIPMSTLGEMWPFYVCAMSMSLARAGLADEATRRLELLDQTALPRVDGQGITGSIMPVLLAYSALIRDNPGRAREYAQRADPEIPLTTLLNGGIALMFGDTQTAIRAAIDARPMTRTLRSLELLRLSLLATALLARGDTEECIETLRTAMAVPRGLEPGEVLLFHASVHELAAQHLPEWPQPSEPLSELAQLTIQRRQALTRRELEVLQGLSRGLSRRQIGGELYLSENTVKAHQQSLYRKLEVNNKTAAVLEGERRGLL